MASICSIRRRRRSRAHSRWSEIPTDILCLILRRLTVCDFIRCSAVCTSWRSAVLEGRCYPAREPPWVIVRHSSGREAGSGVIRLPKRTLHKMDIPDPGNGYRFFGSSNGWLGMQCREQVLLLHPLKGTVMGLPPLTTIPGVEPIPDGEGGVAGLAIPSPGGSGGWVKKVIFNVKPPFMSRILVVQPAGAGTSTASAASECSILAVCPEMRRLAYHGPGDGAWSLVDMPAPVTDDIEDVTSYRGSVYAVDHRGRVAAWDRRDAADATGPRSWRVIISSAPPLDGETHTVEPVRYLVEANGELLQVEREIAAVNFGQWRTTNARVFRLEEDSGEGKKWWTPVRNLGGLTLFLGDNASAAVTCHGFPSLERNCIYFADEFAYDRDAAGRQKSHDLGVYHMRSRTMRLFQPFRCHPTWFMGIWFIPML